MPKSPIFEVLDFTDDSVAKTLMKAKAKGFGVPAELSKTLGITEAVKMSGTVINKSVSTSEVDEEVIDDEHQEAETKSSHAEASPDPETVEGPVAGGIDPVTLNTMIQNAIAPALSKLEETTNRNLELEQELSDARKAADEAQKRAEDADKAQKTLSDLGKLAGDSKMGANVNTRIAANSDRIDGVLKDWWDIADTAASYTHWNAKGNSFVSRDTLELRHFVRENRSTLITGLQKYGKANGLFTGGGTAIATKDTTTISDIVGGFLPVLSSIMRETHRPRFIFHQFAVVRVDPSRGLGNTIQIPRAAYQPGPATSAERRLSGGGTFKRIDESNQSISTGTVASEVEEWGLGANPSAPPISITNFIQSYSMIELMNLLERNLMHDYYLWEDLKHLELWQPTSRVLYNDNNFVTTTVGDVEADDGGQLTDQFLYSLSDYASQEQITPLPDGCYGYAAPTQHVTQLRKSIDKKIELNTVVQMNEMLNILELHSNGYVDKVTGYIGKFGNVHVFESNNFSQGTAGSPGVQTEAIGGGSNLTRSGYFFGGNTIGRGIGSAMEIRFDEDTNFGRMRRAIWHEESSFVAMDVDPTGYNDTSAVPQQLRVFEVRCTDKPV